MTKSVVTRRVSGVNILKNVLGPGLCPAGSGSEASSVPRPIIGLRGERKRRDGEKWKGDECRGRGRGGVNEGREGTGKRKYGRRGREVERCAPPPSVSAVGSASSRVDSHSRGIRAAAAAAAATRTAHLLAAESVPRFFSPRRGSSSSQSSCGERAARESIRRRNAFSDFDAARGERERDRETDAGAAQPRL